MTNYPTILNLIGLICDISGFCILGYDLLKHPDNRPLWSTGHGWSVLGFGLIVGGFALQAVAQVIALYG